MTFLQTGIKMGPSEVDAAYSLIDGHGSRWLLAVEAKGRGDKIQIPQVLRSATSMLTQARSRKQDVLGVIPLAIKIIGPSQVHVVEFDPETDDAQFGRLHRRRQRLRVVAPRLRNRVNGSVRASDPSVVGLLARAA
jgi:hypothetical protein